MGIEIQLLQALCFMYIINTLEQFPPNALALLPSDIRFFMLTTLPLVDVCHLELTLLITGLEMEKV